jgi:hypothetical protein
MQPVGAEGALIKAICNIAANFWGALPIVTLIVYYL